MGLLWVYGVGAGGVVGTGHYTVAALEIEALNMPNCKLPINN